MKHHLLTSILLRNYFLLSMVIILVFIVPIFPASIIDHLFDVFFTLIYLSATLTVDKYRKTFISIAVVLMALLWISSPESLPVLYVISKFLTILFFCLVVVSFIRMISRSKEVNAKVILESINGYLLLGLMFTMLVALLMYYNPEAFSFPDLSAEMVRPGAGFNSYIYFTLVTMSTLGYGDVLPTTPAARSLATFISISGQLYIAIIIAMLVGKFASQKK